MKRTLGFFKILNSPLSTDKLSNFDFGDNFVEFSKRNCVGNERTDNTYKNIERKLIPRPFSPVFSLRPVFQLPFFFFFYVQRG